LIVLVSSQDYFSRTPENFPRVKGWYKGTAVEYFDFKTNSLLVSGTVAQIPIYVLVTGFDGSGKPIKVAGQNNIVSAVLGNSSYSDLWLVKFVQVPMSYVANTIRDELLVTTGGFNITTGPLVNCPVVPINSTIENGPNITVGWYKNATVHYYDFGENPTFSIPIYAFPNVSGQFNIINAVPGEAGYSAFWNARVYTAPDGYVANTYKSFADVPSNLTVINGPQGINCPVWQFTAPSTGTGTATGTGTGAQTTAATTGSTTAGKTSTTGGAMLATFSLLLFVAINALI